MIWIILTVVFGLSALAFLLMLGREIGEHNQTRDNNVKLSKEITKLRLKVHSLQYPNHVKK